MRYRKYILLLFMGSMSFLTKAQNLPDIERLLEYNDILDSEDGYQDMVSTLMMLSFSPLNINTADFHTLKMLFLLSDSQIDQIITHRKKYGAFSHTNELLLITGISKKDLTNILPFITLGETLTDRATSPLPKRIKHELLIRGKTTLPLQEGYKMYSLDDFATKKEYDRKNANRFHGPPFGSMLKYKITHSNKLQVGITLESDAGEGYFTRNQKMGFDFLSAYATVSGSHFLRQFLLGDYRIQWGQGLIAWGGFSSGKSADGNEKSGKGYLPYSSTDENNYLRGAALSLSLSNQVTTDLIVSYKKTDGNISPSDTLSEEELISVSLYETGYHRNNSECLKKHTLNEFTTGLSTRWNNKNFRLGLNTLYYNFTPPLIPGNRPYQYYNDTGKKRWLTSIDYKTAFRNIYLFGETAISNNGAFATINGLRINNSFLSGNLLYRRYDKRYVSHYASGFGEYSNTANEEGVFIEVGITPIKNLKINLYYDWFRFFAPRYGSTQPGSGQELLGEATWQHSQFEHTLRYKYEKHPEDQKGLGSVGRKKSEYRYQFTCQYNQQWQFRTRLSFSQYHKAQIRESGYMIYQDIIFTGHNANFKMQYRVARFNTDSYQSRIYAYENNVLYGYSFPSFMGKGWRTYLNLNWKLWSNLTFYLKSGFTIHPEQKSISSGITKLEGNKTYDITCQLRLTF